MLFSPNSLFPELGWMIIHSPVYGKDAGIVMEILHLGADFDIKLARFSS